jgi:N-formylglutamate deformylase
MHLDIEVGDPDAAGAHALAAGGGPGRLSAPGTRAGLPRPGGPPVLPLGACLAPTVPNDGDLPPPTIGGMTAQPGTDVAGQWVLEPAWPAVPVIACLPHGGCDFPAELAADLTMSPGNLWSDWLTRELYAFLPDLGITTITTTLSRFVADVNRDPAAGQNGGFWSSVVSAQLPDGEPLYRRALTAAEISHRIAIAHEPFHRALDTAIGRLLRRFPRLLLLDLHSFGMALDGDVILGDRHGTTARPDAVQLLSDAFCGNGFSVRLNERFSGGWTVRRFAANDRVDAVQVELNQRCYLDLAGRCYPSPPPIGAFDVTQQLLRRALADDVVQPLLSLFRL